MYHDAHGRTMERMPWAYYVTHGGTVLEEVASFRPLESIVRLLDDERLSLCHRAVCVACCGPVQYPIPPLPRLCGNDLVFRLAFKTPVRPE